MLCILLILLSPFTIAIDIGENESGEMIKGVDCFPDFDKLMFNEIFARLRDVTEVKAIQAKGLDYFGHHFSVSGTTYCGVFIEMLSIMEKQLSYDIKTKLRNGKSKGDVEIGSFLIANGYYESVEYMRLLAPNITSKCRENGNIETAESQKKRFALNYELQQSEAIIETPTKSTKARDESVILACINSVRRKTLFKSISNRVNNNVHKMRKRRNDAINGLSKK